MEKSIRIAQILGDKQEYYLGHSCKTIDKSLLYTPGPDVIEKVWMNSDRNLPTLNNMRRLLMQGRLANTGYVSILPVDQGVEHTAGASFAPNPLYFDPENIVKLAIVEDVMPLFLLSEFWGVSPGSMPIKYRL